MRQPQLERRHRRGKGYKSLPREVVQRIRHSDALAVWTLLMTMSEGWVVREKWVRDELGIGEVRYRAARKKLKSLGLWETEYLRAKNGAIMGSKVVIWDEIPSSLTVKVESSQLGETNCSETSPTYKVNITKPKTGFKNKPAEGGKPQGGSRSLTFAESFGVDYPIILTKHLEEHRAVAVARNHKLDTEAVRLALAELSAISIRGFKKTPVEAWIWACKRTMEGKLDLTASGEKSMPQWAEVSV